MCNKSPNSGNETINGQTAMVCQISSKVRRATEHSGEVNKREGPTPWLRHIAIDEKEETCIATLSSLLLSTFSINPLSWREEGWVERNSPATLSMPVEPIGDITVRPPSKEYNSLYQRVYRRFSSIEADWRDVIRLNMPLAEPSMFVYSGPSLAAGNGPVVGASYLVSSKDLNLRSLPSYSTYCFRHVQSEGSCGSNVFVVTTRHEWFQLLSDYANGLNRHECRWRLGVNDGIGATMSSISMYFTIRILESKEVDAPSVSGRR